MRDNVAVYAVDYVLLSHSHKKKNIFKWSRIYIGNIDSVVEYLILLVHI